MRVTSLKELYDTVHAGGIDRPLFINTEEFAFMDGYVYNFDDMDFYFVNKYYSWEWREMIEVETFPINSFRRAFRIFLYNNKKKLEELFRLEGLDDEKYSLYNNYDMVEKSKSKAANNVGSRTDVSSVSPYDTEAFSNTGKNELGAQETKGESEYELTRVGNIGVMTVSDMIEKHQDLFSAYIPFYDRLFQMFVDECLYLSED